MQTPDLTLLGDNYDYANWLLKTKLESFTESASCETPNERTLILHWDIGSIDMQLDLRLNTKEGWLYTSDRADRSDCLRVYNLESERDMERMINCLKEYIK